MLYVIITARRSHNSPSWLNSRITSRKLTTMRMGSLIVRCCQVGTKNKYHSVINVNNICGHLRLWIIRLLIRLFGYGENTIVCLFGTEFIMIHVHFDCLYSIFPFTPTLDVIS